MAIPTPHIGCSEQGVIAETVLLPGESITCEIYRGHIFRRCCSI